MAPSDCCDAVVPCVVLIIMGMLNRRCGSSAQCPVELTPLIVAVLCPILFLYFVHSKHRLPLFYFVHSEHRLPKRHHCFDVLLLMLVTFLYLQAVTIANPADPLQRRL